jgi:RNA polymerase sigma factor (sigma-70 family)
MLASIERSLLFTVVIEGFVFAYCRKLTRNYHNAEDLASEVKVEFIKTADGYDPSLPLKPFLCGIAHHRWNAQRRKDGRMPNTVSFTDQLDPVDHRASAASVERITARLDQMDPSEGVDPVFIDPDDYDDRLRRFIIKMNQADNITRTLLWLYFWEGMSQAKIAKEQGRTKAFVSQRIFRFVKRYGSPQPAIRRTLRGRRQAPTGR